MEMVIVTDPIDGIRALAAMVEELRAEVAGLQEWRIAHMEHHAAMDEAVFSHFDALAEVIEDVAEDAAPESGDEAGEELADQVEELTEAVEELADQVEDLAEAETEEAGEAEPEPVADDTSEPGEPEPESEPEPEARRRRLPPRR